MKAKFLQSKLDYQSNWIDGIPMNKLGKYKLCYKNLIVLIGERWNQILSNKLIEECGKGEGRRACGM